MVVDDEVSIRTLVSMHFKHIGMDVKTASGCAQCLEHIRNGFKGVVLMDIMMPEKDGWDTIREIVDQGYHENTVIILFSACNTEPPPKAADVSKYVSEYVQKPIELHEIDECVNNYLSYFEEKRMN